MRKRTLTVLCAILFITSAIPLVYSREFIHGPGRPGPWRPKFNETDPESLEKLAERIETVVKGKIVISSINIILYGYILFFYLSLYRQTNSNFSLSLIGLSFVLLVYSLTSNPFILMYLARVEYVWLQAFSFIPDIFSTVAACILIYLSRI